METYRVLDKQAITPLFAGWDETFIWSCLQDCMGAAYTDHPQHPRSAKILLGDFCFLAGEPREELLWSGPPVGEFLILVPQHFGWEETIQKVWGLRATRRMRYATHKDPGAFDPQALEALANRLPQGYRLQPIHRELYRQALAAPWSRDLCGNFANEEDYRENGLGVGVTLEGELVAGASSYTFYRGGIEVEIDTRADHRRRGLARACGARLILDCLARGLYPSWDAHNRESLALAQQLGYGFAYEYPVYEVTGEPEPS